jgi:hypothetical protein
MWLVGLGQLKYAMTALGIELATFRPTQLRYRVALHTTCTGDTFQHVSGRGMKLIMY